MRDWGNRRPGQGMGRECRGYFFEKQKGICYWCGKECLPVGMTGDASDCFTIDHIVPRSRGGSNREDNLVGACHQCNRTRNEIEAKLTSIRLFYAYFKKQPLHLFPVDDPKEIVKPSESVV